MTVRELLLPAAPRWVFWGVVVLLLLGVAAALTFGRRPALQAPGYILPANAAPVEPPALTHLRAA